MIKQVNLIVVLHLASEAETKIDQIMVFQDQALTNKIRRGLDIKIHPLISVVVLTDQELIHQPRITNQDQVNMMPEITMCLDTLQ